MLISCSFFPISWCLKVAIQFLLCCLYSTDTEAPKIAVPKTCNGFVIKPFESSDPAVLLSHEPHSCTIADPLPFSGKLKEDQIWGETPFIVQSLFATIHASFFCSNLLPLIVLAGTGELGPITLKRKYCPYRKPAVVDWGDFVQSFSRIKFLYFHENNRPGYIGIVIFQSLFLSITAHVFRLLHLAVMFSISTPLRLL